MKSTQLGRVGWALAAGGALLACSSQELDAAQAESDHTAGEYVQRNSPLFWNDSSYADFRRLTDEGAWYPNPQPAGAEDPAQQWLQAWADRIDELVRAKVLADSGSELVAPKPTLHLLPSASLSNAWVTGVPACVEWPVQIAGKEPDEAPVDTALLDHYRHRVSKLGQAGGQPSCVAQPAFEPLLDELVPEWNAGNPECQVTRREDGVLEVPDGCQRELSSAKGAAMYAISPHVQFSSDLLAAGSEAGAVFVIAHELAHYYRAHGSPLARHKYNFWYDQDPRKARRPVPSKDAAELQALYREVEAIPKGVDLVIPGSAHTPRQRAVTLSAVCNYLRDDRTEGGDAAGSCAPLADHCSKLGTLARASISTAEQNEAYVALEQGLASCGAGHRIDGERKSVVELVAALARDGYLPANVIESQMLASDLASLLNQPYRFAGEQDAKVAKFAERLRVGHIGLYTTEQEADELALEWVNLLGFTSQSAMDGWLQYLKFFERWGPRQGELSAAQCAELYAKDFKDGRAFTTVWLGDLNSAHHAGCYRVYNLWREQRAHRYVPSAAAPAVAAPSWELVLERAKAHTHGTAY